MKKLRLTSVLTFVALLLTGCYSDIVDDEMEPETLKAKTHAKKKVTAGGEGNEEKPDTCKYYKWMPLDTTITISPSALTDIHVHFTCNEGFSSELRPKASLSVENYGTNNNSYATFRKVELGNNGQIHCSFSSCVLSAGGNYENNEHLVTAQLKVKEIVFTH